jgi:putative ABC transport system permease protein
MDSVVKDIRLAVRRFAQNPGFTVIIILTLGLGIGANTAIFSVVNTVLLRPLPYNEPNRLVTIRLDLESRDIRNAFASYQDIADWRQQSRSFETMTAYSPGSVNLTVSGEPERVARWKVNASFFSIFDVRMALGRTFLSEEDQPGSARVAILSYSLWQRHFDRDKGVMEKRVIIENEPCMVVGILPPGFKVEDDAVDVYTPIALSGTRNGNEGWAFGAYARLKPGVSIEHAQRELDAINQRLEKENRHQITGFRPHIWGLRESMVHEVRLSLLVLFAAVALVLLIACANVATLLLAETGARQKEMAIRAALGAARGRIARQLLTESILLAVLGGASGLLLAYWGVGALSALGTEEVPMLKQCRLDLPVLAFTMLISLMTGLVFGIAPALGASNTNVSGTLQEAGRSVSDGLGRNRLRSLLVISEVALALLLMIGASLMIRSFLKLRQVNPGFNPANVLTASITLPSSKYSKPELQIAFFQQLEEKLQAMPGNAAVGFGSILPLSGSNQGEGLLIEGRPVTGPSDVPILWIRRVNPGYFQAMQIPLRQGRLFTERDTEGTPRVLIVNETMARRYWPNQDPIGKRVGTGAPKDWMPVVGVIGDVRHMSLKQEPDAEIYLPYAQNPQPSMNLVMRTSSDPLRLAPIVRRVVLELDPEQPVSHVASMEKAWSNSMARNRFSALLLGIFAAAALTLAVIGIYGVISFSVMHRRREIGIRMALGARSGDVLRMVVGQGALLALVGVGVGVVSALALTRIISSLLYGVKATDPRVFLGVSLLFVAIALLASYVPARRAARVDPMVALWYE